MRAPRGRGVANSSQPRQKNLRALNLLSRSDFASVTREGYLKFLLTNFSIARMTYDKATPRTRKSTKTGAFVKASLQRKFPTPETAGSRDSPRLINALKSSIEVARPATARF